MSVVNSVRLIGRLGKDPEEGNTNNGGNKLTFSLGVARIGGTKDVTDWFYCTLYGKPASTAAKMLRKGSLVAVEGSVETWKKENGTGFGISCSGWQILEPKGGSRAGDREAERQEEQERSSASRQQQDEDEFPF